MRLPHRVSGTGRRGAVQPEANGMAARRLSKGQPMLKSYVFLQNFLAQPLRRDDRGATAVEYGLIVALIAAASAAILFTLGGTIRTWFTNINGAF
jgi:pilus assembly protein Flp/PilA